MNKKRRKESQIHMIYKRLRRNKSAMLGLIIFIIFVVLAVFAPIIAPYDYSEMNIPESFIAKPSLAHLCGTDQYGRDIFSRLLYGARYSLALGICAEIFGVVTGIILGAIAGYYGNKMDMILLRFIDILQAMPGLLLAIVISSALGSGFFNTVIALGIGCIPMACRMTRGQFLALREIEYVEASNAIGCSKVRQMFKHMLPNAISPMIVAFTMGIGATIMSAASLSYIGLGVTPPEAEWGAMLVEAKEYIRNYPHLLLWPGLCIFLVVLGLNMFGDGLRDAMDPKLKD